MFLNHGTYCTIYIHIRTLHILPLPLSVRSTAFGIVCFFAPTVVPCKSTPRIGAFFLQCSSLHCSNFALPGLRLFADNLPVPLRNYTSIYSPSVAHCDMHKCIHLHSTSSRSVCVFWPCEDVCRSGNGRWATCAAQPSSYIVCLSLCQKPLRGHRREDTLRPTSRGGCEQRHVDWPKFKLKSQSRMRNYSDRRWRLAINETCDQDVNVCVFT